MSAWLVWLILCSVGLTLAVLVVVLFLVLKTTRELLAAQQPVMIRQLELVDKVTAIAVSKDVMSYQGIQVMNQPSVGYDGDNYDPSDEAAAAREAERYGMSMEEISAREAETLSGLLA